MAEETTIFLSCSNIFQASQLLCHCAGVSCALFSCAMFTYSWKCEGITRRAVKLVGKIYTYVYVRILSFIEKFFYMKLCFSLLSIEIFKIQKKNANRDRTFPEKSKKSCERRNKVKCRGKNMKVRRECKKVHLRIACINSMQKP